jgi:hypothetical protein
MSELKQKDGESPTEWLARLRHLDPDTLSEHQRFFLLQHALDSARVAVKRQEDDASYAAALRGKESLPSADKEATVPTRAGRQVVEEAALELCKRAYLALGQGDRERFTLWAADGCK